MTDDLAAAIDAVAAETDFSGVVSVTEGDAALVAAAYGLADRAHDVPNTARHPVRDRERHEDASPR